MLKLLYQVHKWIGLTLVAAFVLQASTGTLVVFKRELSMLSTSSAPVREARSPTLDQVVATAHAASHGRSLDRVVFPSGDVEPYVVRHHGRPGELPWIVRVDQSAGQVLAAGPLHHFPLEAADRFHQTWLLGATGQRIIGFVGLGLLAMLITGVILWWPPRRAWKHAFRIHWRGATRVLIFDLHRVPGAILVPALLISVVTGTAIAWRPWTSGLVRALAPVGAPPALSAAANDDRATWISLEQVLESARHAFQDLPVRDVRFTQHGQVIGVILNEHRATRPRAVSQFWVDRSTGRVLWRSAHVDQPAGNEALDWLLPIHSGEWLGLTGRAVLQLTGIGMLVVLVTGIWMWLQRRRVRHARAGQLSPSARNSG